MTTATDANALLIRLCQGLEERRGDRAADAELAGVVATLANGLEPRQPAPEMVPPHRVSQAMALALFAQPHLAYTFAAIVQSGTCEPPPLPPVAVETPLQPSPELMEAAFGLPQWSLEDLRDEVDRRAARSLKQVRVIEWLWQRFGVATAGAAGLYQVLFPGTPSRAKLDLIRRGTQLYAISDQPRAGAGAPAADPETRARASSPSALFLPWLVPGLPAFEARYVDGGLRRALGRSLGCDDPEVEELLELTIVGVARATSNRWMLHDAWRWRAFGGISGLGCSYRGGAWLTAPIAPDVLATDGWLHASEGRLVTADLRSVFDRLAAPRVTSCIRQLYAEMLARAVLEPDDAPVRPGADDLDLYDVANHLRPVLQTLVAWCRAGETHAVIAALHDVPVVEAARALEEVAIAWTHHAESAWLAAPKPERPQSLCGTMTLHLVATHRSLRRLLRAPADYRGNHRELVVMFAAHYLAEARIERLWVRELSDAIDRTSPQGPRTEDVLGEWFWHAWQRLLDAQGRDSQATGRY